MGRNFILRKTKSTLAKSGKYERVGPQSCLWQTKTAALTKKCVLVHCYCKSTSPGSATTTDIFSGLTPSDVAKPPASNAEYCLAWRKKF